MLEVLRVGSHLVLLFVQAVLLQLVWTQPAYLDSRRVRWTRISLLPLTLGVLFSNHAAMKDHPGIVRQFKVNLGCTFAGQLFKSILLAFTRPSAAEVAQTREAPQGLSAPATLVQAALLVVNGSSNPAKQPKLVTEGPNHTVRADLVFLLSTIRRMLVLNSFGLLGLYCWKSVHDDRLVGRYPMLKRYEAQMTAVVWGLFCWTGIDLTGCLVRLAAFASKSVHRLLAPAIPSHRLPAAPDFSRVDLEQTCPFLFANSPLEASSISAFWGRHWHTVLQGLFVEAGAVPLTSLVRWAFGTHKPPPKLLRLSGIIGAFAVSAIMHEVGVWSAGPFDRRLRTSVFFLSQGVAVCLESAFKSLSGQRVTGPLGRIWTFAWLIFFGTPMIDAWLENLTYDKQKMLDEAERLGFWRMLFTPLILPKLIFSRD